ALGVPGGDLVLTAAQQGDTAFGLQFGEQFGGDRHDVGDWGAQALGAQSSVSTPWVDFGCRNATSFPAAPSKGVSLISLTPASAAPRSCALISVVANATW